MERKDCTAMSNADIKIYAESLKNEFEHKKIELLKLCKELDEIDKEYIAVENEIEIRKKIIF